MSEPALHVYERRPCVIESALAPEGACPLGGARAEPCDDPQRQVSILLASRPA